MSDEPYYTKIPEWATEGAASGMATATYQHLAKRINRERGDRIVDPSRARLAADLCLKKADDVDPYLRELDTLGMAKPISTPGKRTRYFLPERPPAGYDGPMSTVEADRWQRKDPEGYAAWHAAQRAKVDAVEAPYKEKKRARVTRSAARKQGAQSSDLPVATGTSGLSDLPVATGTYLPVATGNHQPVATGPNQTRTNEGNRGGDGRRPPTGSKGASSGGCAAPASDPSPPKPTLPWATIRLVLEAIPKPLAELLDKRYEHQGMPEALNEKVMQALEGPRTVAELHERIGRRWMRYEDDALSLSGRGIQEPIAVLYELLAPSYCEGNNPRCEDGIDLDRGQECRICEELKAEFHASRRPVAVDVPPVPEQRDVVAEEPRGPLRATCSVCSAWRIQVAVWEGRPVCASCIQTCTACQTMQPEFNYGPDSGECRGCRQLAPAPA